MTVYPFYYQYSNNWQSTQSTQFQVSSRVDANEIALFTSDRAYDPNNITISLEYPNGTGLTTGQFSVQTLHGDEGLTNAPVNSHVRYTASPATLSRWSPESHTELSSGLPPELTTMRAASAAG